MPFRFLAGVSANLGTLSHLGWSDLSAGIAIDGRGSSRAYFGLGFHF
jgi:hypothetical protein